MDPEIKRILDDHEKRLRALEGKEVNSSVKKKKTWYKPGSTIEKIVILINEGFFDSPHTITEIISELKTRDYHLKSSDLTLPLRKIIRKGLLRRTKKKADSTTSKNWLYLKV